MSEFYTDKFTPDDYAQIDAMLLRLRVMRHQDKPCRVSTIIPFRPSQAAQEPTGGKARVYIYKDEVARRRAAMLEIAENYVAPEVKIARLIEAEEEERSRRAYVRKCNEIETLLDELAGPGEGSILCRFYTYETRRGTGAEATNFVNDYMERARDWRLEDDEIIT